MSSHFNYQLIYSKFSLPITEIDCGSRCAPYNERGIPFCCDIQHAVPTAYLDEWDYLQKETDLWKLYHDTNSSRLECLASRTPADQILLACKGHHYCVREFRALSCRSFPFFPYITRSGEFLGLSYFWEFEDRCWVISHLDVVSKAYLDQFVAAYQTIFDHMSSEIERYRSFSAAMRRVFGRRHRAIPLLHRNGNWYKITPKNGRMRRVQAQGLPKFSFYKIAAMLPFPDELSGS